MVSRKIEDIQILRAVAILFVLAQHLSITITLFRAGVPNYWPPFWSGVELFFVISGFVVTTSLLNRPLAPLSFLVRRGFRLIPAMLCFLALTGAITVSAWLLPVDAWGKEQLAIGFDLFMRQAASILAGVLTLTESHLYMNGAMWSLSVEFQFYFAFAVLLFALMLAKLPLRLVALCVASALWIGCVVPRLLGTYQPAQWPWLIQYCIAHGFDFLFLGVIGATGLRPLMSRSMPFGPALALGLLIGSQLLLSVLVPEIGVLHAGTPTFRAVAMPLAGLCFLGAVLIASVDRAFAAQGSKPYRFFVWIGELSYSIYLFHFPVFALFWIGVDMLYPALFHIPERGLTQMLVCLPLILAIAALVYRYVEVPMNRLGAVLTAGGLDNLMIRRVFEKIHMAYTRLSERKSRDGVSDESGRSLHSKPTSAP